MTRSPKSCSDSDPNLKQGLIFEIREFSLFDGPGIRTTVFLKGCPLRCLWCHNPEGLSATPELLFSEKVCVNCQTCRSVCPRRDDEPCRNCGQCAQYCPTRAKRLCGYYVTVEHLVSELLRLQDILKDSHGGVTFSGGEPLLQVDFVTEVARQLRKAGVHVAVETSGFASADNYQRLIDSMDLVIQDVKHPVDTEHLRFTGVSNRPILSNLETLKKSTVPFVVRVPLVPTVNDSEEVLTQIARLLANANSLIRVELLPYHASSGGKYALLRRDPPPTFEEKVFGKEVLVPFERNNVPVRLL